MKYLTEPDFQLKNQSADKIAINNSREIAPEHVRE